MWHSLTFQGMSVGGHDTMIPFCEAFEYAWSTSAGDSSPHPPGSSKEPVRKGPLGL